MRTSDESIRLLDIIITNVEKFQAALSSMDLVNVTDTFLKTHKMVLNTLKTISSDVFMYFFKKEIIKTRPPN